MSVKESLKKIPGLRPAIVGCKNFVKDVRAMLPLLAERRVKRSGPIRVAFLCQYIPAWHKLAPIYERMVADPLFAPMLICVPSGIEDGKLVSGDGKNDTLDYFRSNGYTEAINALNDDGTWLELAPLGLSYIFYPRPYNYYMPADYHCEKVSRYCKICMILYGMNTTEEVVSTTLNREFFRYVACYFAELPYSKQYNEKVGVLAHRLGLQKSLYFGMPGVEAILAGKDNPAPAWDFSKNSFRAMWTPRWTTDLSMGGSNFFTYYQVLLDYACENPDADLLFRPHPLAISHFLQTGKMTQQQADEFANQCAELANVSLDTQKEYIGTMWNTDVLISDISGLIPEYFVTGKPLIFCASNMILTPEETTAKILQVSYIVHNKQELVDCLNNLKQGIDPLKAAREKLSAELFRNDLCNPSEKILQYLVNNHRKEE